MKILVTGARGQLGAELCRQLGPTAIGLTRAELDLEWLDDIEAAIAAHQPDVVINCAAFTQVDRAETEKELCWRINAHAVERLARVCERLACRLIQISTDYVFGADANRSRPYEECDSTGPLGEYGRSKEAGERAALSTLGALVIRTCGLYSRSANGPVKGRNFVETMLCLGRERPKLRVVCDQICSPSYVPDVAAAIVELANRGAEGIYHVVNQGLTNWHELAVEIFGRAEMPVAVEPITTKEYGAPAPRPAFSALATEKTEAFLGQRMPTWREGLGAYFSENGISRMAGGEFPRTGRANSLTEGARSA